MSIKKKSNKTQSISPAIVAKRVKGYGIAIFVVGALIICSLPFGLVFLKILVCGLNLFGESTTCSGNEFAVLTANIIAYFTIMITLLVVGIATTSLSIEPTFLFGFSILTLMFFGALGLFFCLSHNVLFCLISLILCIFPLLYIIRWHKPYKVWYKRKTKHTTQNNKKQKHEYIDDSF